MKQENLKKSKIFKSNLSEISKKKIKSEEQQSTLKNY